MDIWKFIETQEEKEEPKKDKKEKSGGGGSAGVIEPPKDPLEILNETIEKNYKDFLKLQKNLTEFDTTLSEIPEAIKPSIIANYNTQVTRFNSLIGELQINLAERDKIYSTLKKQDFVKKKQFGIYQPQQEKPQPQESGLKDIWDAFRLGASGMVHKSKQYFNSVLPNMIFRDLTVNDTVSQYAGMTQSQVDKLNIENKKKREVYKEGYERGESNYNLWLQKNPELQPRPEWEKGVIETIKENPKILADPTYWGYVAAQSAAFTLGIMSTVLATTAVTGNPLIGLASGVLVATPMQTQELYEDLIDNGATEEEATKLAIPIGGLIASVEVMGDLPILASVSAPFKKLLFGNIRKGVVKATTGFLKKGIKRAALIEVSETLEEIVQGAIQDATVKTVNENRNMLENIPETIVHTLIATAPFALVGLGSEAQITSQLKEKVTNIDYLNAVRVQLEEQGFIPRMEAEAFAYKAEEEPKAEPKEPTTPEELEAKREMLRKHGIKENLLADDEFVKKATIKVLEKADVTDEEMTPEETEQLRKLRESKVISEVELTKEKVLEKVEKPKVERKEPTELFKDIDAYTKIEEGHKFKVMRSGKEYSHSSRGGTWYEIETWEGKKSAYLEGQGQYGLPGVGGKTTIRKELVFKNPYMFEIPETKTEGEIPIKLWEEVKEKTIPNKKGFFGKDIEKHFAKLEKEVSNTLKEKGYDGVVLYEKVGANTYPKQIFDLKTEPKEPTTPTTEKKAEVKKVSPAKQVEEPSKVSPKPLEKITKETKPELPKYDRIKDLSPEALKVGNKLIGQIHALVSNKGLNKKQFTEIKMKYGEAKSLSTKARRMTPAHLEAVLKAVEKARPRQIKHEKVITPKTEKKILSLKENLIDKLQMTEEAFKETLKDVGIYKEPKYIDAENFITEQKGKELIYRLIDESNILRVTEPLRIALEKNPEAKKLTNDIDKRIESEGKERLKDPHELNSMRKYIQIMEATTDAPFFPIYQDMIDTHLENRADMGHLVNEFDKYRDIIKNKDALKRVENWILAKSNLKGVPEAKNITNEEIELAKKIQGVLKDYEAKARTEKFLDNIEHPEDMPQYIQYRKEINKAKDIYESKGYDDLVDYMKTQEWGVIKSGYSPLQVVSPKVRLYKARATTLGKSHIKVRKDIEYKEQDKDIIQRLFSYKRQMDNLSIMRPKIRAFVTLTDKNLSKFKDPGGIKNNIEIFFRELKGYDRPENWFDRGINRLYAQAMTTIIMGSPALAFRNLGQNFALGHDKAMLIDPRNKNLTADEIDYLNTYVQQAEFMRVDWFMTGEKPLPGLKFLTDIIKKVNLYPRSDIANRHWGFWGKINQVKRAFDKDVSLAKKMEEAKFSDMTLMEQKRALQILSKDGQEAMEKYVTRVYVDDVHFLYERAQRSPAEMGRMGRVMGNLMLFPRAYWEKLAQHSKKMTDKKAPFKEQVRAFKVIASVLIGGMLVSAGYKKVTGRRKSPYDPLELLAYEPGGLAIQTINSVSDIFSNMVLATKGDERALATLTTAIPEALDMFIPFYNYALRGVEAATNTKNIDKKTLRKLRMLIDKEYQVRGGSYKLERNAMEKWQYFLGGAGVDTTIKEREKKEKEKKIKITEPEGFGGLVTISEPKGFGN